MNLQLQLSQIDIHIYFGLLYSHIFYFLPKLTNWCLCYVQYRGSN